MSDKVYKQLRDALFDGSLQPGSHLVEKDLAEMCGVSRTPVREALRRLEHDGLVERTSNGLTVRTRTPEEIMDIYETRIILEVAAARTAAERASHFDRMRLEKLLAEGTNAQAPPAREMARLNRLFHQGVWAASNNASLIDLLERLNLHLLRFPETTLTWEGRWSEALLEHSDLYEAIAAGDADTAGNIARQHFETARDIRIQAWRDEPSS